MGLRKSMIKFTILMLSASIIWLSVLSCSSGQDDSIGIATSDVRGVLPAVLEGATPTGLKAELQVAGGGAYQVALNPDGTLSAFIPGVFAGTHTLTMSFFIMYVPAAAQAGTGQARLALGQASMTVYLWPGMNHIIFDFSSLTFPEDDGDGISNLDELLLGTDPLTKNIVEQYLPLLPSWGGVEIRSLFFTSEDDGWAVGYNYEGADLIMHYQSGVWKVVDDPVADGNPGLNSVHFPSVDEGWAVGTTHIYLSGWKDQGVILHYQSGQWSQVAPPDMGGANWTLNSVFFPSVDEGWAVGDNTILHYSSGSWSAVDLSGPLPDRWGLRTVYFISPDDGWAVGWGELASGFAFGVIFHYSGGTWSLESAPLDIFDYMELNSVQFTTADEGWAVGVSWDGPVILHYSHGSWSLEDISSLGHLYGLPTLVSISFPKPGEGWVVGKDLMDEYNPNYPGLLLHYQNGAWSQVMPPYIQGSFYDEEYGIGWYPSWFNAIHFPTADKGWIGGAFLTRDDMGPPDGTRNAMILSHDAGAWTASSPLIMDSEFRLADLSFPDASEGWAVGDIPSDGSGMILHYQDGAWSDAKIDFIDWYWRYYLDPDAWGLPWHLYAVDFPSVSLGWVVGAYPLASGQYVGGVLHYDSGIWSDDPVPDLGPNNWYLYDVNFPAADQGWAVGEYKDGADLSHGVILNYQSGTWVSVPAPETGSTTWYLTNVQFPSPDQGWAVGTHCGPESWCSDAEPGDGGILLHYDSGVWTNVTLPDPAPGWYLSSVSFPAEDEGWAVGMACPNWYSECDGIIYHYAGGSWQLDPTPAVGSSVWALIDVFFVSPDEGWAVGVTDWSSATHQGLILHYSSGQWQVAGDLIMEPRNRWNAVAVDCADQNNCLFGGNEIETISLNIYKGLILKY